MMSSSDGQDEAGSLAPAAERDGVGRWLERRLPPECEEGVRAGLAALEAHARVLDAALAAIAEDGLT